MHFNLIRRNIFFPLIATRNSVSVYCGVTVRTNSDKGTSYRLFRNVTIVSLVYRPAMSTYPYSIPWYSLKRYIFSLSLLGSSGDREDTYCAFSAEYRATFRKIRNTRCSFSDARGGSVPRVQYAFSPSLARLSEAIRRRLFIGDRL